MLSGYKTYLTAGGIILSVGIAYATGNLDVNGAAAALAPAVLALPLRSAIAKLDLGRIIQALQAAESFLGSLQSHLQQADIKAAGDDPAPPNPPLRAPVLSPLQQNGSGLPEVPI